MTNGNRLIVASMLTALLCGLASFTASNCSPKQAADVDKAADVFCALHVKNKETEARYGITPTGTHAKVEAGADMFCALREQAKRADAAPEAAGSTG